MRRRWRCGLVAGLGALLLCLAAGRGPALAQAAPDAVLGEAGAAQAELLAELVRYAQGLGMQVMLGQLDRATADARLADMAGQLRAHGAAHDLRETILGVHHRAAVDLFDTLARRIGEGARWPGDRPAEVYKALARITLLGARTLYDSLIARRLDTRSALAEANLVHAWTVGRREVTPDVDFLQRAPLDAEYHLGPVAIPVPQKPAGERETSEGEAQAYLGCFRDDGSRDLNGASYSGTMTAAACIAWCGERGFAYAGTQYSSQCFCGASYGRLGPADNCDMACSGDAGEICGGTWANSVYGVAAKKDTGPGKPTGGTDDGAAAGEVVDLAGNLALGRPARQSSTSSWSRADDAQGAVDGVINGSFGFHTESEANPWWQVDLGAFVLVGELRIFNRVDCCPERASTLRILFSDDGEAWRTVYTHDGTPFGGNDGNPLVVRLNAGTTRFVRLQLAATDYFHLDEVEIYAPGVAPERARRAGSGTAAAFLGCFRDAGDPSGTAGRDLNGVIVNDPAMTTALCIDRCRAQGFGYAGTQNGAWCFCGTAYGSMGAADTCTVPCAGEPAEVCGGPWANSVYRVE